MDILYFVYQYILGLYNITYLTDESTNSTASNGSTLSFQVTINTSHILNVVDERFLSVGISPKEIARLKDSSTERKERFELFLRGLSPCYLRAAGTDSDVVTFNSSKAPIPRPRVPKTKGRPSYLRPQILYDDDWDFINNLAVRNNASFLFQINALTRREISGEWDETNFLELLDYTIDRGYASKVGFEFGNEPTAYPVKLDMNVSATEHAWNFLKMAEIMKNRAPYAAVFSDNLLVAPDIMQPKPNILEYLEEFLEITGHNVDKIGWHHYNMCGGKDVSPTISNYTLIEDMDALQEDIVQIQTVAQDVGLDQTGIWITETASAYNGGVDMFTNRFVDGFMWLDKLGLAASQGIEVVIRYTLTGGYYGMLDKQLEPLPDYWLSYVYKSLVGRTVYNTTVSDTERKLRCYSADQADKSGNTTSDIVLYCVNLHDEIAELQLDLDVSVQCILAYILQPYGEDGLQARYTQLNGQKLELVNGQLPQLYPMSLDPYAPLVVPASSLVFFTIHTDTCD